MGRDLVPLKEGKMSEGRLSRPILNLWAAAGLVVVAMIVGSIITNAGGFVGVMEGLFVGKQKSDYVTTSVPVVPQAPQPVPRPAPSPAPAAPSYNPPQHVPHGYLGHGDRPLSVGERQRLQQAGCTIVEHPTANGGEFQQTRCPAGVDMMSLLDPDRQLH